MHVHRRNNLCHFLLILCVVMATLTSVLYLQPLLPLRHPRPLQPSCLLTSATSGSGHLDEVIAQYVALLALSEATRCPAQMTRKMADALLPVFQLDTPVMDEELYSSTRWRYTQAEKCRAEFPSGFFHLVGVPRNLSCFRSFLSSSIKRKMTLQPEVAERAQRKLRSIDGTGNNTVYVGLHVTKNASGAIFSEQLPDSAFYAQAVDHFRLEYEKAAFVVLSDDVDWARKFLPRDVRCDLSYFSIDDASEALALLASCNHSVVGGADLGYFASLLTSGQVVFSDALPVWAERDEWIALPTDPLPVNRNIFEIINEAVSSIFGKIWKSFLFVLPFSHL